MLCLLLDILCLQVGVAFVHRIVPIIFVIVNNLKQVFHGVQTPVFLLKANDSYLFNNLPDVINVGRYHSWVVDQDGFPESLVMTAVSNEGQIMALRHKDYDVQGIQFHPESVLTPEGRAIISNWLNHE